MKTLDKDIENLVISINDLYEESEQRYIKIKHSEDQIKKSIANLSHDLRTPLTSIMGYIQLIKSDRCSKQEKEKYLNIVDKRTETLRNLITSFYELSIFEASEYRFMLKSVNLENLLYETLALYYDEFTKCGIEPQINAEGNCPSIISDEKAVVRIFSNLINNIIKHGQGNVVINLIQEKNYLVTEFINNAEGLNEEDVKHIFDRFFTADLSRSDKNTGLGLSITKALVEALGNSIEADYSDGKLIIRVVWNLKFKI
jgi:signal transduction histidine kinase